MARPAAICFDMGYTLLEHTPTGPDLYRRVLGENGVTVTVEDVELATRPAHEFYIQAVREGRPFESSMELATEFWAEYNAVILDRLGLPRKSNATLGERIYTEAWSPAAWRPFPEVLDTLAALRAEGIKLAIISNFVDTLGAVCDHHGLTPHFDLVLSSVAAGAMKPDPAIFALALHRLGVSAADSWHVGDNFWADILGARAAGMTGVFLDRAGLLPHPDGPAVRSLDQLLDLVSVSDEVAA
jgi:putative hydrolase of the HAD superfamily